MPTDKIEISERAVSAIASSAERFIGYIYAGVLPILIFAIENAPRAKQVIESLGGVLTAISALVIGIGIFTVYFRVLGNFLLFPIQHVFHWLVDRFASRSTDNQTSPIWLLYSYGVPFGRIRDAYHAVRSRFFKNDEQIEVQVSHGELHVLYLTATCLLVAFAVMTYLGQTPSQFYLYIGTVVYFAALFGDTHQHSVEAISFRAKAVEIRAFLEQEGLARRTTSAS